MSVHVDEKNKTSRQAAGTAGRMRRVGFAPTMAAVVGGKDSQLVLRQL